jgi:hypothetical protein
LKTILNFITSKKVWVIFLFSFIVILLISRLISSSYSLFTGSYKIDKSELVLIDSFRQQGRYFATTPAKSSRRTLTFKSQNGYSFVISNKIYEGCKDKSELEDKLMYHDLHFIVYSDKKTHNEYFYAKKPIGINVLQIEISGKRYIDTDLASENEKGRLWKDIVIATVLILILLYFRFSKDSTKLRDE